MSEVMEIQVNPEVQEVVSVPHPTFTLSNLHQIASDISHRSEDYLFQDFSGQDPVLDYQDDKLTLSFNESFSGSTLSPYAFKQLCTKLGVPARYVLKCLEAQKTSLALENVNSWLRQYTGSMFVRTTDNKVRGLLSSRYSVLDTHVILEILDEFIDEDEYKIKGYFLSPERFHLRLVQKQQFMNEEDLFAGFQIDSSDVGRSVLKVTFMIFKQVCTNGLVVSKGDGVLFQQRHVGISYDDFRKELAVSFNRIPDLTNLISNKISESRQSSFSLVGETPDEQIQDRRILPFNFSSSDIRDIIAIQDRLYNQTKWGFISAITDFAKTHTLERRIEIEEKAGKLLIA